MNSNIDLLLFIWVTIAHGSSIIINTFLILIILFNKLNYTLDIQLILFISVSDLLTSTINLSYTILKYIFEFDFNYIPIFYCQLSGILISLVDNLSSISIFLLAFERYQVLCNQKNYKRHFYLVILFILFSLAVILAALSGIGNQFEPSPSGGFCTLKPSTSNHYLYFQFLLFNLSLFFVLFFYISITISTISKTNKLKNRKRFRVITRDLTSLETGQADVINFYHQSIPDDEVEALFNIKVKVIFKSMTFCLVYISLFIPNLIEWWMIIVSTQLWSTTLDLVTILTYSWVQAANPLLAICLHSQIRSVLVDFFKVNK
ncbi:family A G protein-coupled receptor-like protein [Neoconidiobolus thromboides FSU 785]|nr:family A G protein-coupled receptor-like protein [Neoconidiobolus thromboides FSU 785]